MQCQNALWASLLAILQITTFEIARVGWRWERDPLIQKARSRYQLLSQGIGDSDLGTLEQQANRNPVGPEAFEYAKALAAQEQYANALERMMMIMNAPGEGVEPSRVKESLIALINTCPDAKLANQWRRQLFTLLH